MGDLNIHHKKWLKYSNADTLVGADLKKICDFFGLWQAVREPTRNEYLLDLLITNIHGSSVKVTPKIADHKGILCKLPFKEILEESVQREVWDLRLANWKDLQISLDEYDWGDLRHGTSEDALALFHEVLWNHLIKFIPRRRILEKKSSHPWLNDRTSETIKKKNAAEGTPVYEEAAAECARILKEER